jgi:hypothetical protein
MFFPLEFYSLFLADTVGANFYILLLCGVSAFLTQTLFGFIWKLDFGMVIPTIVSAIFLLISVYIYSIFFYSDYPYLIPIFIVICAVPNFFIIAKAKNRDPEVIMPFYRRKPIMAVCYALLLSFTGNLLTLLLFVMSKNEFISSMGRG